MSSIFLIKRVPYEFQNMTNVQPRIELLTKYTPWGYKQKSVPGKTGTFMLVKDTNGDDYLTNH